MSQADTKPKCRGTNKQGNPCKAAPWANGYCIAHQDLETRKAAGHKSGTRDGAKRDPLRVPVLAKQIVEANATAILYPYMKALGLKLMRVKSTGEIVVVPTPETRAKLFGISKDGVVKMSSFEDLGAMISVAEKLMDRVYGRPRQALEISGDADGGPVQVQVASDNNRALEVSQILAMHGAIGPASRN